MCTCDVQTETTLNANMFRDYRELSSPPSLKSPVLSNEHKVVLLILLRCAFRCNDSDIGSYKTIVVQTTDLASDGNDDLASDGNQRGKIEDDYQPLAQRNATWLIQSVIPLVRGRTCWNSNLSCSTRGS